MRLRKTSLAMLAAGAGTAAVLATSGSAVGGSGPTAGLLTVKDQTASNSSSGKELQVACPPGYHVTGGGADVDGGSPRVAIHTTQPAYDELNGAEAAESAFQDAWRGAARETTSSSENWQLEVYAVCTNLFD